MKNIVSKNENRPPLPPSLPCSSYLIIVPNINDFKFFPVPCKTVGDRGRPCIFPFKYNQYLMMMVEIKMMFELSSSISSISSIMMTIFRYEDAYGNWTYNTCTTKDSDEGQPWSNITLLSITSSISSIISSLVVINIRWQS